ncbi:unnamed protein product [Mycena citricolor]|uniref:DUF803-domain-containing protein n=1 Tax=Mycena citricolor TaxID=2018698 RepID=A0AAD2HGZ8_9AGAR|nr:unnamed protein product [Mycena citricolor]
MRSSTYAPTAFPAASYAGAHPLVVSSSSRFGVYDLSSKLPELNSGTVIGISIAILGNILISLALNLQKLAHKRLEKEKNERRESARSSNASSPPNEDAHAQSRPLGEAAVLLSSDYGAINSTGEDTEMTTPKKNLFSRILRPNRARNGAHERTALMTVDVIREEDINHSRQSSSSSQVGIDDAPAFEDGSESDYLKTKLWWAGFTLMNVGEMGNFISYAWAPASVVAPLGTFALMANCVFAPLMLGERFRKRDILGIFIAVIGAVTVVLASNASDTRMDPDALLKAISQIPFIVFSGTYIVGAIVLAILSERPAGKKYVFIDVGLRIHCAFHKAVSTLLTMQWLEMFTRWITYPTIAVLALTGVGQIRYLNRALMRFDGKVVIPIQFVFFTISAIVGSAVLYGDFKKASFHQLVTFLYGCAATFAGVFIIAWDHQSNTEAEADGSASDPEDSEEERERSLSRRRPTLVVPNGFRVEHPLNHKPSSVSMLTLSPARPLLLVHTPPREIPERWDPEHQLLGTPGATRRRALSQFGEPRSATVGRQTGSNGRTFRHSVPALWQHGSLPNSSGQ